MDDHSARSLPFRKILHLTDFSRCSDAALILAKGLARANQATLSVLHAVVPDAFTFMTPDSSAAAFELQEKWALGEMQQVEARLADLPHETMVAQGRDVWSVVEPKLKQLGSDLIVLGTHGRTGFPKMLMGSVAERVLRSSTV